MLENRQARFSCPTAQKGTFSLTEIASEVQYTSHVMHALAFVSARPLPAGIITEKYNWADRRMRFRDG